MKNYFKTLFTKSFIKKIIYKNEYSPIVQVNDKVQKRKILDVIGGDLNPEKVFYVIRRTPGTGLFSNLAYVINHIQIARRMGFIPIVDMENYPTVYNEKQKIFGTNNSWEYYFEKLSDFNLDEIYQSKNIIMTDNKFYRDKEFKNRITSSNTLVKILKDQIKIKKTKLKTINFLKKKLFDGKKILGVHHRGTGYKITEYPITINQMINIINEILEKEKYDKIFYVTEDLNNFNVLRNYFGEKMIFFPNSQRGKKNLDVWKKYPRLLHRYKLGRDILYETFLLSYCDGYFDIETNPTEFAHAMNLNPNQKRYTFNNGINRPWYFFKHLNFSWHIKKSLPEFLGGFKKNKKPKKYYVQKGY
jgi:hypothetical protein